MHTQLTNRFPKSPLFASPVLTTLFVILLCSSATRGQFGTRDGAGGAISGSVLIEGQNQPAAMVRVNVRPALGGVTSTMYTDSNGHFQAYGIGGDSYIVSVSDSNYEPVEQSVDRATARVGVLIFLKRAPKSPRERGGTVSVADLKVPDKARRELEKGYQRLAKNDLDGGLRQFQKAVEAYPDYYEAYYRIGVANLQLKRWEDAESALQRAIELGDGRHAHPYLALGALYCQTEGFTDAERVLRRALEIDSGSSQGYLFLGQAVYGLNRIDEAEKDAQAALSRKADEANAYLLLANIHIKENKYVLLQNDLREYLRLKPSGPNSDKARATLAQVQSALIVPR